MMFVLVLVFSLRLSAAELNIEITRGVDNPIPVAVVPFAWDGANLLDEDIGQIISSTIEAEQAMAQLDAAVRSTGGAAGYTAEQLAQMAAAEQKLTTYGDEAIMQAQAVMLAYT